MRGQFILSSVSHLFSLWDQAIEWLLYPVIFILISLVLLIAWETFGKQKRPLSRRLMLTLLPFIFPILLLVWGTVFHHESDPYKTIYPSWIDTLGTMLELGTIVSGILLILLMKNYRWFVSLVSIMAFWLTMVTSLVAGMSVTGDWL